VYTWKSVSEVTMQKIVSLAKRRGFIFPGSEIYGGLANTYDMGPLGVEMLRNIVDNWWNYFVHRRNDMYGLDTAIIMSPKVWEASGHVQNFVEALIDCRECNYRTRADYLIENYFEERNEEVKVEGKPLEELDGYINENEIPCPSCGKFNWTKPRIFNNLFETHIGILDESQSLAYLRGEIAQGMFTNFKNVLDTVSPKLPFGIAQYGKAFRNEITKGNFIFRTLEFNLAEFEYFINPLTDNWEKVFEYWKEEMMSWITSMGVSKKKLRWRTHTDDERSHYSSKTEDLDYEFPFGYKELFGLAYRTDFDLRNHMEKSGVDLRYSDSETGEKFIPHVVEPTFGISRVILSLLADGYAEEKDRVILKLHPDIAPYKAAVFPLVRNKKDLVSKAREVYGMLKKDFNASWDDRGNIGKRYLSQDEIGTPYCVTIDYSTLEDNTVTVRDRDTTKQKRVKIDELVLYIGGSNLGK